MITLKCSIARGRATAGSLQLPVLEMWLLRVDARFWGEGANLTGIEIKCFITLQEDIGHLDIGTLGQGQYVLVEFGL